QKAERKSVRHAIQSTAIVDQAKAGLLNIDQKKVWLAKQEVDIEPGGNWANVKIHEVYENQTNDVEEILYYFSLPESSAITGLWLGESEDLKQRFAYQVAPRGAAQEVYNNQVRRTRPVDPALLEQVGPGQYRLRAFPVPPKRTVSRNGTRATATPKMHLWLTYQVMQQEGGWALPQLAEKRNIYWNWQTKRIRDGRAKWFLTDNWWEDFAKLDHKSDQTAAQTQRKSYQVSLKNGYTVAVQPLNSQEYTLPENKNYALILDTSYSMREQRAEITQSIDWWRKYIGDRSGNNIDLYLTDDNPDKAKRLEDLSSLNVNQLTFYGSLQTDEMLQQFATLRQSQNYDAVLLLTDQGSYELAKDKSELPEMQSPLWLVHLGGQLPRAYADATLEAIQNSNGGVAKDLATVIKRLATEATQTAAVVDGYSWTVSELPTKSDSGIISEAKSDRGLKAIAARQLVSYLAQKGKNQLSLQELDAIHRVAKSHDVVTPYSSMIVLVNDDQREQLKAAEAKTDRFDREVETGTEQLDQPFNPFESNTVSGVPEPDVWLLLAIVSMALFWLWQKQGLVKESDLE
ncbi:MAG: TIGR02921 family PEP-CTERM protein, partial [Cyanobacteria bacterium J06633_1]